MSWKAQQEEKEALALQDIKMPLKKPKISYNTIRKNTNLDKYLSKKTEEEDEEEAKNNEG